MTRLRRRAWMLRQATDEARDGFGCLLGAGSTIMAMVFGRVPPGARSGVTDADAVAWRDYIWCSPKKTEGET